MAGYNTDGSRFTALPTEQRATVFCLLKEGVNPTVVPLHVSQGGHVAQHGSGHTYKAC